ncbi:MAG: lactonase family protein, partial [Acidobacteriota bacterium]|nr:lactonase family protein [Acidobacteriota bacterium]
MTLVQNGRRTRSGKLWQGRFLFFLLAIAGSSNCSFGQFVYMVNGSNAVSASAIDANSGVLTQVPGSPFATGAEPAGLAVDVSNKYVYVANAGSNDVSAYAIDRSTGALRAVPGSPFAAGAAPAGVAIDRSGRVVYVANSGSRDVSAYMIDSATGALMALPGSPFAVGTEPASITISPAGNVVYVVNSGAGSVSAYTIDAESGVLLPVPGSPFAAGRNAASITIDPKGRFAYVTTEEDGHYGLSAFGINAVSGALARISGASYEVGDRSISVAVHPDGRFVYVSNGGEVSAYAIDANTGALTPQRNSRLAGRLRSGLVIDRSGKFAYAAGNQPNNIAAFSFETTTGALRPVSGLSVTAGAATPSAVSRSEAGIPVRLAVTGPQLSGTALVTGFTAGAPRNNFTGGFGMQFTVGATPLS